MAQCPHADIATRNAVHVATGLCDGSPSVSATRVVRATWHTGGFLPGVGQVSVLLRLPPPPPPPRNFCLFCFWMVRVSAEIQLVLTWPRRWAVLCWLTVCKQLCCHRDVRLRTTRASRVRAVGPCDTLLDVWYRPCDTLLDVWYSPCDTLLDVWYSPCDTLLDVWYSPCDTLPDVWYRPCDTLLDVWYSPCDTLLDVWYSPCDTLLDVWYRPCDTLLDVWYSPCDTLLDVWYSPCDTLCLVQSL